jgi:hypothetical protein
MGWNNTQIFGILLGLRRRESITQGCDLEGLIEVKALLQCMHASSA